MAVYSFWIYDRHCNCVFSRDYAKQGASVNTRNEDNQAKLLFGVVFSMRKISNYLVDDKKGFPSASANNENKMLNFSTLNYKCHYFETLTGLKFVVITDPGCRDLNAELSRLYSGAYRQKVVENGASPVDFAPGECIQNEPFVEAVDQFWAGLPEFK